MYAFLYFSDQIVNGTNTTLRYDQITSNNQPVQLQTLNFLVPSRLEISTQASSDSNETVPFPVQTVIQVFDTDGNICENLGLTPWILTAQILSGGDASASLLGTVNTTFVNGTASFTDLAISHAGSGYQIRYSITYPTTATLAPVQTGPHNIHERELDFIFQYDTNNTRENTPMWPSPNVTVIDKADGSVVETGWKGRSWWLTATLMHNGAPSNEIYGTPNATIVNGVGALSDFGVSEPGTDFQINFYVNTTPASSYSGFHQSQMFNVSEAEYKLVLIQGIGDCNDTVVCGIQPIVEVRHIHPDGQATALNDDGVQMSINASLCSSGDDELFGNNTIEIDYLTGRSTFHDLRINSVATNLVICFELLVNPDDPRYNHLQTQTLPFNVTSRQFYLVEVTVPVATTGSAFSVQPVLEIYTVGTGSIADPYSGGISVTAAISNNPNSGVLAGNTVVTASGARVTFTDLQIDEWGLNYTLVYTSPDAIQVSR